MAAVATAMAAGLGAVGWGVSARPAAAQSTAGAGLLALLNRDRAAAGLPALSWDARLAAVGESAPYAGCGFTVRGRAEDMVERNYFAHPILGCGGQNVFAMLRASGVGYSAAGENIGWVAGVGDPGAQADWLDQQFMASPEHRANILNTAFTSVGIGVWSTAPGQVWTGGGSPQSGVVMVAEEFAALPRTAAAVAPRVAAPAVAPPHVAPPAAPAVPAAARSAAPTAAPIAAARPAASPGLPETGVVAVAASPPAAVPETGAAPAPAASGPQPPALPLGGAGVLLGGAAIRRFRPRG